MDATAGWVETEAVQVELRATGPVRRWWRSFRRSGGFCMVELNLAGWVTENGDIATWTGQGTARMLEGGRMSFRGAIYFQTNAERLARLNGACGVYEHEVDGWGKTEGKIWEWK